MVFVQTLSNGLLVYPGGQRKPYEQDSIEVLLRELGEESRMSRGQMRTLRNWDLIYGALEFRVDWYTKMGRPRLDTYHMILDPGKMYDDLTITKGREVRSGLWVPLQSISKGISPEGMRIPDNIRIASQYAEKRSFLIIQ